MICHCNLRSSSFADLVRSGLREGFECPLIDLEIFSKLKVTFESLTIELKEEIKSSYYYRATNKRIELEQQTHDFIITKPSSKEKRVIFNTSISLEDRLFYLTEIVFDEIVEVLNLDLNKHDKSNQWRLKCKISKYLEFYMV